LFNYVNPEFEDVWRKDVFVFWNVVVVYRNFPWLFDRFIDDVRANLIYRASLLSIVNL
jgi:hypothetical protein